MKKKYLFTAAGVLGAIGGAAAYLYGKQKKEAQETTSPDCTNKIILSKKLWREHDTRKTNINNNFLLIGSIETAAKHFMIPNILEENSSYVIVDPEGRIYEQVKDNLELDGYEVKCLNLSSQTIKGCIPYNPFAYAKTERDMMMLIDCLLTSNALAACSQAKFWFDSQRLLLMACAFHLLESGKTLSFMAVNDLLDDFSEDLFSEDPKNSLAAIYFKAFAASASGHTKDAVVKACIDCLHPFCFWSERDDCSLEKLSDKKIALFLISDAEPNTISKTLIPLLFQQLYEIQHEKIMGYAKNNITIPYSSVTCFIQGKEYLKAFDREDNFLFMHSRYFPSYGIDLIFAAENISEDNGINPTGINLRTAANCDSIIYYSSPDLATAEYVSKRIGDEKIFFRKETENRRIMTSDELLRLPEGKCVVIQKNEKAVIDDVY